ncbi:hypothetical protein RDABS01_025070 [Bienertia sinuspersici]
MLKPSSSIKIPNFFLRKKRKWIRSPYKTRWHYLFNQQQALQTLKRSCLSSTPDSIVSQSPLKTPSYLLNCLINSFDSYQCDPTPTAYDFVIKTLIQKSQFNELNHVLSHLQNVEKMETPEWVFVDLIRVYGENGMINEAIDLFFRMPKFRCVPTVLSLNSLLFVLCRNRECLRIIPQLILKSSVMNIRMEESSYSILINALCRIGRIDFAIKLLNCMIFDEFDPDGKLYSMVLSSLCRQKDVTVTSFEVLGVWEDMKRGGFNPGKGDFCNVIKFLGRQGKGKDAFDVLCEMKRERIKPDIMSYTMALYGLVEEREFSRVEELFDEILIVGLVPNLFTYNVYIKSLCEQKKADDAYTMISCIEELGCQPNLITYNTVLEAFCKVRELTRVREVWSEMKRKSIEVDHHSYSLMIDALLIGGEAIEACKMLEEMLFKSFLPLFSIYDKIIHTLCQEGLTSEALHTLQLVSSHDVLPGSLSWKALVSVLNLNHDHTDTMLASLVN